MSFKLLLSAYSALQLVTFERAVFGHSEQTSISSWGQEWHGVVTRQTLSGYALSWSFFGHGLKTGIRVTSSFSGAIEEAESITFRPDVMILLLYEKY